MSAIKPLPRPSPVQSLGYTVGRPMPAELREWVRHDLNEPRATSHESRCCTWCAVSSSTPPSSSR